MVGVATGWRKGEASLEAARGSHSPQLLFLFLIADRIGSTFFSLSKVCTHSFLHKSLERLQSEVGYDQTVAERKVQLGRVDTARQESCH